jgi:hypothetical protein
MPSKKTTNGPRVILHTQVTGRVAEWLVQMKDEGYVTSYTDAVHQGLILLHQKFMGLAEERPTTEREQTS